MILLRLLVVRGKGVNPGADTGNVLAVSKIVGYFHE